LLACLLLICFLWGRILAYPPAVFRPTPGHYSAHLGQFPAYLGVGFFLAYPGHSAAYPLALLVGQRGVEVQPVGTLLRLEAALGRVDRPDEQPPGDQRVARRLHPRAGESGAAVQAGAVPSADAAGELAQADAVRVLAESVGAARDVHQHLELGA